MSVPESGKRKRPAVPSQPASQVGPRRRLRRPALLSVHRPSARIVATTSSARTPIPGEPTSLRRGEGPADRATSRPRSIRGAALLYILTFRSARDPLWPEPGPRPSCRRPTPNATRKRRIGNLDPPLRGTAWWRVQPSDEAWLGPTCATSFPQDSGGNFPPAVVGVGGNLPTERPPGGLPVHPAGPDVGIGLPPNWQRDDVLTRPASREPEARWPTC